MEIGRVIIRLVDAPHYHLDRSAEMVIVDDSDQDVKVIYRAYSTNDEQALDFLEDVSGIKFR